MPANITKSILLLIVIFCVRLLLEREGNSDLYVLR